MKTEGVSLGFTHWIAFVCKKLSKSELVPSISLEWILLTIGRKIKYKWPIPEIQTDMKNSNIVDFKNQIYGSDKVLQKYHIYRSY